MVMEDCTIKIVLPECNLSTKKVNAIAELGEDISEVLPYLNAAIKGCSFNPEAPTLRFIREGKAITLHPRQITIAGLEDEAEARQVLDALKELINGAYERRDKIEPSYRRGDEIKVLDVFKLLPGTNCRQCDAPTCLTFPASLVQQEADLAQCSPLFSGEYEEKKQKLGALLQDAGYDIVG
ncbi:MAG: (Fe-S)-binding protein [Thermodesulfobacteriota bacterium]